MVFFSMVTIKVVCQVGSLLDTYDSQCTQIYHSFTVYLKGASPFAITRKNDAFVAKIVNTRLTKIFIAYFAPDERLPTSATLD